MVSCVTGKMSAFRADTEGGHRDRSSGSGRFRKQEGAREGSPTPKRHTSKRCGKRPKSKVRGVFSNSRSVLPGWAVLDCGAAKSLSLEQILQPCWLKLARKEEAKQEMITRLTPWKNRTTFVGSEKSNHIRHRVAGAWRFRRTRCTLRSKHHR